MIVTFFMNQDLDAKLQSKAEELLDAESYCDDLMEFLKVIMNFRIKNKYMITNAFNQQNDFLKLT